MLYSYTPITHAEAGDSFVYEYQVKTKGERDKGSGQRLTVQLKTPDTAARNWSLHASSIWVSAVYLADHIHELNLGGNAVVDIESDDRSQMEVLELGAGAGLPGIILAKHLAAHDSDWGHPTHSNWRVTLSDYPDDALIQTLRANASSNRLDPTQCRVIPYAWGEEVKPLLPPLTSGESTSTRGFDLIMAADVLWNAALHHVFVESLRTLLRRSRDARIYLVAGLHTGRYTIRGFLQAATQEPQSKDGQETIDEFRALEIESVEEREVRSGEGYATQRREWAEEREGEDEMERRRWVVWIVLRWKGVNKEEIDP